MQTSFSLETSRPLTFSLHGPARQARLNFQGRQVGGLGDGRPVLAVLYGHPALDVFLASEQAFSAHVSDGGQGAWEFAADGRCQLSALDLSAAA